MSSLSPPHHLRKSPGPLAPYSGSGHRSQRPPYWGTHAREGGERGASEMAGRQKWQWRDRGKVPRLWGGQEQLSHCAGSPCFLNSLQGRSFRAGTHRPRQAQNPWGPVLESSSGLRWLHHQWALVAEDGSGESAWDHGLHRPRPKGGIRRAEDTRGRRPGMPVTSQEVNLEFRAEFKFKKKKQCK